LFIVGAGVGSALGDIAGVRVIDLEHEIMPLGVKRNWMIEQTSAPWIAHWDDDDWYAPERLEKQMTVLRNSGKQACGVRTAWFDDGVSAWKYQGLAEHHICGTSLIYSRSAWQSLGGFPKDQVGEDVGFALRLSRVNEIVAIDDDQILVARDHAENTSKRDYRQQSQQWQKFERTALPERYLKWQ